MTRRVMNTDGGAESFVRQKEYQARDADTPGAVCPVAPRQTHLNLGNHEVVLFILRCVRAQDQLLHAVVFSRRLHAVWEPLHRQARPLEGVRHHQIVQKGRVLFPNLVLLGHETLLELVRILLIVLPHVCSLFCWVLFAGFCFCFSRWLFFSKKKTKEEGARELSGAPFCSHKGRYGTSRACPTTRELVRVGECVWRVETCSATRRLGYCPDEGEISRGV